MRTIAEQFKYWQEALDDFQKNVEKDLDEIRRYKSEVQQMKIDLIDHLEKGRYIRDDQRVIISAPEIIIGNVDKSGMLCGSSSKIILRGTDISLDGVGAGASGVGSIVCRASSIRQIAVDPGIDGQENVAKDISESVGISSSGFWVLSRLFHLRLPDVHCRPQRYTPCGGKAAGQGTAEASWSGESPVQENENPLRRHEAPGRYCPSHAERPQDSNSGRAYRRSGSQRADSVSESDQRAFRGSNRAAVHTYCIGH